MEGCTLATATPYIYISLRMGMEPKKTGRIGRERRERQGGRVWRERGEAERGGGGGGRKIRAAVISSQLEIISY